MYLFLLFTECMNPKYKKLLKSKLSFSNFLSKKSFKTSLWQKISTFTFFLFRRCTCLRAFMLHKNKLPKTFLILVLSFGAFSGYSQGNQRTLQWRNESFTDQENTLHTIYTFNEAIYDSRFGSLPLFSERIKAGSNAAIIIGNAIYEDVPAGVISSQDEQYIDATIRDLSEVVLDRKQPFLQITLLPFRKNASNGKIEKLVSFRYSLTQKPGPSALRNSALRTYAAHSVLSSGKWYKMKITENGVHRLDYADLQNMGIDPASIDPKNIRIYGNGGGYLPELNSKPRLDDLYENPIRVSGENDGRFDQGDYILFYAQGPDRWLYSSIEQGFFRDKHPYSNETYYFLTTDLGAGKRIGANPAGDASSATINVTTFQDYRYHEVDRSTGINTTIKSGRERFGEEFNNVLNYDFSFNFPNLDKSIPVKVKTKVLGRSQSPTSSSFTLKFNGQSFKTINCGGVSFNYDQPYGVQITDVTSRISASDDVAINIAFNKTNSTAVGFLDFMELNATCALTLSAAQMPFRNFNTIGAASVANFNLDITGKSNVEIWDVSDPVNPAQQLTRNEGNIRSFTVATPSLKEFIAFDQSAFLTPGFAGKVANQDLHATGQPQFVIVAHPDFVPEAERLASFRRQNNGLDVMVITPDKIYNEFSCGARDASAIRDFLKMLYDRAGMDESKMPRYLLMFGDGSYDNKDVVKNNTAFLPTFQSKNSFSPITSYVSDDYFGLLDDQEGGWEEGGTSYGASAVDVAVGRLPVQTPSQARQMVDKIIHYSDPATFGDWRNNYVLVADDEDNNLHLGDAESNYNLILSRTRKYNIDKIYLDSYPQESTPAGNRYPGVNSAINQRMSTGALVINYIGHGGEIGLGHEKILTIDDINSWKNYNNMPLLMTATCSFSRWDDPAFQSAGELTLLNAVGGSVALFTTTRVVGAFENKKMNEAFIKALFDTTFTSNALGDIFRRSKNLDNIGLTQNNRNFTLLGDPSLPFGVPKLNIISEKINNIAIGAPNMDTLKALSKVTISGYISDANGNKLNNYNGVIYPVVFDKKTTQRTLGQDRTSIAVSYELQKNIIYKGKASVSNGEFTYTFVVPKDISYQPGYGRLSYYSNSGLLDANGNYDSVIVGGSSNITPTDKIGPEMQIFLNDEKFAFGGITGQNPILIVKLKDENGINTIGNGIGHDLTATLIKEDQSEEKIDLNRYYEAKLDSYQEGEIRYPLLNMSPGKYKLRVKAWDVFNNSSENTTEFTVTESKEFGLAHVLNYPNPFTTKTDFQFEHNRPGDELQVQVQIFTVSGKLVKTINQDISGNGSRVTGILWDGRDDFGDKIGRGVYVYRLKVRSSDGSMADKYEKLVVLN